jgi:predicted ATP-grasp superfamily ATP-dependent carboligase
MTATRPHLVVAVTARALAASAARAGMPVVALDLFDDADTRELALASKRVSAGEQLRFCKRKLFAAARDLAPPEACAGLVYGAGFEPHREWLSALSTGRKLYGNAPQAVALVKQPASFFGLLDRLAIPHPEISLTRPADCTGWLVKQAGGSGGVHVRRAQSVRREMASDYYQRYEPGRVMSALFLADRRRGSIVGFSEQWVSARGTRYPFCYRGAIGRARISAATRQTVAQAIDSVVAVTGLVGLNGLDFILDGERLSVLEVNPRPTASIDLYDADYPQGLFYWHLRACEGELSPMMSATRVRAQAVVYARRTFTVSNPGRWPEWVTDRPHPGTLVRRGAPVCSVHAEGGDRERVQGLIAEREAMIEGVLIRQAA